MSEYQKTGKIETAALRAGMDRKTAAKHLQRGASPAASPPPDRHWRTRPDPFVAHWNEIEERLRQAPELEAKALFEWLHEQHPQAYQPAQVRTFQRRVEAWRAVHGPPREVFFAQEHQPGRRLQTDFTHARELGVSIAGEDFDHLLCHSALTYSNWEWAEICASESFLALKHGLQSALWRLGHLPREHWTDHTTAATHRVGQADPRRYEYNENYRGLLAHFGIEPHTIGIAQPNENGDVESLNGALKRRLKQHLLLRGSGEFSSVDEYRQFLHTVLDKANRQRQARLTEELAVMRTLELDLLPEYEEETVRVSRGSTIQVERKVYSVPSTLIGQRVQVRRYPEQIEVYRGGVRLEMMPRLSGAQPHAVNYRHLIEWLVRKPGAFRQYRFREDLFPSLTFRWAYDELNTHCPPRVADLEYLRLLQTAARTMESQVEAALQQVRALGQVPRWARVLEFVPQPEVDRPLLNPLTVNLAEYDQLLVGAAAEEAR